VVGVVIVVFVLAVATGAFGLWVIVSAWTGHLSDLSLAPAWLGRLRTVSDLRARFVAIAVLSTVAVAVTGWWAVVAMTGTSGWLAPTLWSGRRRRGDAIAKTEAIAEWAETLRDAFTAAGGLHDAIATTAPVAPEPIAAEVARLAARARQGPLRPALTLFASELAHPTADLVVAALSVSAAGDATDIAPMLAAIARTARRSAATQLHVEAERARTLRTAHIVTATMVVLFAVILSFARRYLAAFATFPGQIVLLVAGAGFGGALAMLDRFGRPLAAPRLLTGQVDI
jgi:tight adherence protein B